MSGARITIDGLWRCLCPSIDVTVSRCITTARRPPHPLQVASSPRCFHTTDHLRGSGEKPKEDPFASLFDSVDERGASKRQSAPDWLKQDEPKEQFLESATKNPTDEVKLHTVNQPEATSEPTGEKKPAGHSNNASTSQDGPTDMIQRLIWGKRLAEDIPRATTEQIYETLRKLRTSGKPKYRRSTAALVRHLLASGEAPDTFIYETLLLAHAATDGSADAVKELLREMRHKKLPWSSTAYHAALQVLTAQPEAAGSSC